MRNGGRYLFFALFLLVLVTPLVLRSQAKRPGAEASDQPSQPKGNAARLVVVSPHAENIRTEFADAFSAWHQAQYGQSVLVDYRIYGGATDIVRYFDSAKSTLFKSLGTYQVDIVWGGGDDLFDTRLRAGGHLQGVKLPESVMRHAFPQQKINGLALYDLNDDPPQWFGTALSSFGIVYNKDVLHYLGLPEPSRWSDLRDPRYRGWVVLADPTRSAVARTAFMLILEREIQESMRGGKSADEGWARGMGLIRQIAANARLFTDSGSVVSGVVGSGDAGAGMAIDFQARAQLDAVRSPDGASRLGYIEPVGVTSVDPVAMVKGAEHREIAVRFIEFLLSDAGQRLWITRAGTPGGPRGASLRRMPVVKDVYDHPANFTDDINPFQASPADDFNTIHAAAATSGILAELIQMSCIEPLDELKQVPPAKLPADFPFGQQEALSRLARWKAASVSDRLRLQRQWTEEFRQEYRRLRD